MALQLSSACDDVESQVVGMLERSFVMSGFDTCDVDRHIVARVINETAGTDASKQERPPDKLEEIICQAWLKTEQSGPEGQESNKQLEKNLHELKKLQIECTGARFWPEVKDKANYTGQMFRTLSKIYSAWGQRTVPLEQILLSITGQQLPLRSGMYRSIEPVFVVSRGFEGARWLWTMNRQDWTENQNVYVPTLRTLLKTLDWNEETNTLNGNSIEDTDYITQYIKLLKEAEILEGTEKFLKRAYDDLKKSVDGGWEGVDELMLFLVGIFERDKLPISKNGLCWDVSQACKITPTSVFETVTRSFVLIGFDNWLLDRKTVAKAIGDILTSKDILMPTKEYIYADICKAWLETEQLGKDGEDSNRTLTKSLTRLRNMQRKHQDACTWFNEDDAETVFCILSDIRLAWGTRTLPLEKVLSHLTEDSPNSFKLYMRDKPKPPTTVNGYYRDWWNIVYRGLEGAYLLWHKKKEIWTANQRVYVPTLRTLMKTVGWDEETNTFKGQPIKDGDFITTYKKLLEDAEKELQEEAPQNTPTSVGSSSQPSAPADNLGDSRNSFADKVAKEETEIRVLSGTN